MKILVAGAGGFVGSKLVGELLSQGHEVRAVSRSLPDRWMKMHADAENYSADLRDKYSCYDMVRDCDQVYNLAATVGGIGFIKKNRVNCMLSSLINTHLLMACEKYHVQRYFFASSSCVYGTQEAPLKESDAYPARCEDGYGWEKLFSERMCENFRQEGRVDTRIARCFTIFGPGDGNKEGKDHAPAALCKKIIHAKLFKVPFIEIWGDGEQTRNFLYIDDCLKGIQLIMNSGVTQPVNLGGSESITVNKLVDLIEFWSGTKLERRYLPEEAVGVKTRNSDNTFIKKQFGWEPNTTIADGIGNTYRWLWEEEWIRKRSV